MAFWVKKLQIGQFFEKWMSFCLGNRGWKTVDRSSRQSLSWMRDNRSYFSWIYYSWFEFANYEMKTATRGAGWRFNVIFVNFYECRSWHQSQSVANSTDGPGHENLREGHLQSESESILTTPYVLHNSCGGWVASTTPGHLKDGLARTLMRVQVLESPTVHLFINLTNLLRGVGCGWLSGQSLRFA